jgi:hypothetical protein
MILLSILKQLENDGFGTIDADLFLEVAPLDSNGNAKEGIWIVARGNEVTRFDVGIQSFDIYSRYTDKLKGHQRLDSILKYLKEAFADVCDLPAVPPHTTQEYFNVRIIPTSSVESAGIDEDGKVVRVISGEVYYNDVAYSS